MSGRLAGAVALALALASPGARAAAAVDTSTPVIVAAEHDDEEEGPRAPLPGERELFGDDGLEGDSALDDDVEGDPAPSDPNAPAGALDDEDDDDDDDDVGGAPPVPVAGADAPATAESASSRSGGADATALAPRAPARAPDSGVLGGYYDLADVQGRDEPKDGGAWVTTGAILLPIGLLQTGAGAIQMYVADASRCASIYSGASESTCQGLFIYGAITAVSGGLMAITGAALLGAGLAQRAKHRAWQRERGLALAPAGWRGGGGLTFTLRF